MPFAFTTFQPCCLEVRQSAIAATTESLEFRSYADSARIFYTVAAAWCWKIHEFRVRPRARR